jgi:hypothetical protein
MKTRMKKLISISTIPVLALALLLVLGTVLAEDPAIQTEKPAPSLTCTTEYDFVGHLGTVDAEGRLLAWEGTISGDIEGVILWWFDMDYNVATGQVSHWVDRWEIWDGEVLLLAGDEEGTTTAPPDKDGMWQGNGVVTEANEEFEDWIGRPTHDGGVFTWTIPGELPDHGEGTFHIN